MWVVKGEHMHNIQIGSLVLNGEMVLYIVIGLAGWLQLHLYYRNTELKAVLDQIAFNILFLWIFIWKGSLLILDPLGVMEHPSSLLYYSGGVRGRWIAFGVIMVYAIYKKAKEKIPLHTSVEAAIMYVLGGYASFHIVLSVIDQEEIYRHLLNSAVSILLSIGLFLRRYSFHKESLSPKEIQNSLVIILIVWLTIHGISPYLPNAEKNHWDPNPDVGVQKGQLAVDFELLDATGKKVTLSDFRGKRVLLNFWATWCPPCRVEMPHLQKFYHEFKDSGVVVLGVNLTSTESSVQKVKLFAEEQEIQFPILLDERGEIMQTYRIRAYPTTFIIDSTGKVQEIFIGAIDYETMKGTMKDIQHE
jgi:peroxiredoxin